MNITLEDYLRKSSLFLRWQAINEAYISEAAAALTRVNYNQSPNRISALAGLIALAPDGSTFTIKGGTSQIPRGLLELAKADVVLNSRVERVEASGSRWKVLVAGEEEAREFDAVVVAAPLPQAGIEFAGFSGAEELSMGGGIIYQSVHTTYVAGKLSADYFAVQRDGRNEIPDFVGTTQDSTAPFSCLATQPGNIEQNGTRLVKLFSVKRLRGEDVDEMFEGGVVRAEKEWAAYPVFQVPPVGERRMRLTRGLYYVNALEAGASAIEVGAVAGTNVAKLFLSDFVPFRPGVRQETQVNEL
jgi:hypothetical protein